MRELMRGRSAKTGLEPGTLVYVGPAREQPVRIDVTEYDAERVEHRELRELADWEAPGQGLVTWINVSGVHDAEVLRQFGERFGIHPLVLEDIHNTRQRPKVEDYDDYLFVVLKMLTSAPGGELVSEQVCLIIAPRLVISFQEERLAGDVFGRVRDALRAGKGRARTAGGDYLAYLLVDAVVDHYFAVIERLGERMDAVEDAVVADPRQEVVRELHRLKRELVYLRNSVWPLREAVNRLERGESELVTAETRVYLRDVYDHTVQVMETVETFRDMAAGMMEIYLSSVSNRLNSVMKVLTVIATIFIPLTFIVGIYGMNFDYMPELRWRYGYPAVMLFMLALSLGMLAAFRWRRWI